MKKLVILATCIGLSACGGGGDSAASGSAGGGGSTKAELAGAYLGAIDGGVVVAAYVLNDGAFWMVRDEAGGLVVVQGDGDMGSSGAFSLKNGREISADDSELVGMSASAVVGDYIVGTVTNVAGTTNKYGIDLGFDTKAEPLISDWQGNLTDGAEFLMTVSAAGSITGNDDGCNFTGTISPDAGVYSVSFKMANSLLCDFPNQTLPGIAMGTGDGLRVVILSPGRLDAASTVLKKE